MLFASLVLTPGCAVLLRSALAIVVRRTPLFINRAPSPVSTQCKDPAGSALAYKLHPPALLLVPFTPPRLPPFTPLLPSGTSVAASTALRLLSANFKLILPQLRPPPALCHNSSPDHQITAMARRCKLDFSYLYLSCLLFALIPFLASPSLAAKPHVLNLYYQSLSLVTPAPLLLPYRNGPVLSGHETLDVYLIWYGNFSVSQKGVVEDFLHSFSAPASGNNSAHAVSAWWSTTTGYVDSFGRPVISTVKLTGQVTDGAYTQGKTLKPVAIENLILGNIHAGTFPSSSKALYMVLTAADVYVDGFCLNSCGFHAYTFPSEATGDKMLPYAWVGNAATQCPGQCAWPFANADFGPQTPPLRPPNADTGMDGMVINLATVMAGAATNPFNTGYYQGDAADPLEAVSACTGIFGKGAYPGYPGELLTHSATGSSFNAHGINERRFLVPAMWNPSSLNCMPL